MPSNEVKHRKGKPGAPPKEDENTDTKRCFRDQVKKDGVNPSEQNSSGAGKSCVRSSSSLDLKTLVSFVSLSACLVLAWVAFQQHARFIEVEEKHRYLYEKAADLLDLEEKVSAVSKKLEASEDHLKGALSTSTLLTRLEQDVASLNNVVTAIQEDQHASSRQLQSANRHFLNVTETWQGGLASVTDGLVALRSESRSAHGRVTESVNEAESRLRALAERLEELEDSTRRNARALERTEDEDARRVQEQLDWNTGQVERLRERLSQLSRHDAELQEKLDETAPRAQECAAHLPAVEEAVRSILRLGADLSSIQERMEALTLQVLGTEDSMLKALGQILELRRTLDELKVEHDGLPPILEAEKELQHTPTVPDSGWEKPGPDGGKDSERSSG
ncbi:inhibitor of nuclear factor kappa-B kinase-interacting protein isoform X1 [Brachyhypopomus gauderio]|uniref:inhibitor of nuclear factor kappa-B kinase-interacting protein isoform X1 n=1 Tax=Brachyhypopomus gauderio TaxID=698409 RepID=UPI0040433C99